MKKLNKFLVVVSAVTVMGIFTGCASKGAVETAPAETTSSESTVAEPADDGELVSVGEGYGNPVEDVKKMVEDFVSLIGQADDKVVALLGEGIIATDDTPVSLREYNMELFGEGVVIDAMYDVGKITGFQIYLDGTDMSTYEKQITDSLGKPEDTETDTNDGSTMESSIWKVPGANVELVKADDVIKLLIYVAQ